MASSVINRFNSTLATDPLRQFRFFAEFTPAADGVFDNRIITGSSSTLPANGVSSGWTGGFTSIDGLAITTQNIPYREGGYNTTVHQVPGMTTFVPITFSRGVLYGNDQAITWMRGMFAAASGEGLATTTASKGFRVNVKIFVNDHPNADIEKDVTKMAFTVHNAWISQLNFTNLDATNGAIMFETMQLVHEGLSAFFTTVDKKDIK